MVSMARTSGRAPAAGDFPLGPVGTARPKRKSPARRIFISILLALLALILLVAGAAFWFVQRTLPTTGGELSIKGLTAPVSVARDSSGIPHITAANIDDLFLA